jgi:flagellar basal-body rod modification protein FlgD
MASSNPIAGASTASAASTVASRQLIGQNFDTFLRLLTTQLQHQNPLDPLDTNQFTQQLVQFAQVEQQINMNSSLNALIALQQTAQLTQAVDLIGKTVVVGSDAAALNNSQATWKFSAAKAGVGTLTVIDANGRAAYSRPVNVSPGSQSFVWDGRGNGGLRWPDGQYRLAITAVDASGQPVAVSTEVTGIVDSIDVTRKPPVLLIGGQSFTVDSIKQVLRTAL